MHFSSALQALHYECWLTYCLWLNDFCFPQTLHKIHKKFIPIKIRWNINFGSSVSPWIELNKKYTFRTFKLINAGLTFSQERNYMRDELERRFNLFNLPRVRDARISQVILEKYRLHRLSRRNLMFQQNMIKMTHKIWSCMVITV